MSVVDENKKAIKRLYAEFFGKGDMAVGDELLDEGYVENGPLPATNREEFKMLVAGVFQAFPDVVPTVDDMVADGDRVAVRVTARGTHQGEFMGIPPTNKEITWHEMHIYKFADGKVVEHWAEMSMLDMMQQLGAIPPTG